MGFILKLTSGKALLVVLLCLSLGLHYWLAGASHPYPFATGSKINVPAGVALKTAAEGTLRVATFNIHRSKGNDGVRDIDRVASVFKDTDVIGLQELSGTLFYGWQNQAQQLAERLDMGWLFAPSTYRWYQPYFGMGLLSKLKIDRWTIEPMPMEIDIDTEHAYRNLIIAETTIKGTVVTLMTAHVERNELNEAQLKFVLERFARVKGPVILMGDLNTAPGNVLIDQLLKETNTVDGIYATIGEFWRLDWILTRGFKVLDGGYTPRGISDHAHYWVDLELELEGI